MDQIIKMFVQGGEIFVLFIMIVYLIFAFVLIRRLKLMNLNLSTPYKRGLSLIANAHFLASLVVIVLTFLSLKL